MWLEADRPAADMYPAQDVVIDAWFDRRGGSSAGRTTLDSMQLISQELA